MTDRWTTPWYPGDVKPHRRGVYERKYDSGEVLPCKWDGFNWWAFGADYDYALMACVVSEFQDLPWRGLRRRA